MQTIDFRTKTIMMPRKNVASRGEWGMAIDIGYSGVKLFSPNIVACFPAFAILAPGNILEVSGGGINHDILYRESKGAPVWMVGKCAQDILSPQDPDTSSMAIYGRQRYFSEMFMVLARTALGIAMTKNEYGNPDGKLPILETGLPNAYLKVDSQLIKEALEGQHVFDLKVGDAPWAHYDFTLAKGNVRVMAQPMGTFLSICTDKDGKSIAEAANYYNSRLLICDPGFGTLDCFAIEGKTMTGMETFDSLGMKQVMLETRKAIFEQYHVDIPVPVMQTYLERGYITTFDRKTRSGQNVDFSPILEECSKNVAEKAIDKICEIFNYLQDFRYLVLTGGTGEAWYKYFAEAFAGMPNLTIIPGNVNDNLPFIFSNVRGYYMYLQHKLMKK